MNAPKAFASLSGGLLARKGSARPAMRRQNFGQVGPGGLDDLGWNDMGFEAASQPVEGEGATVESINRNPLSGLTPSQPVVHDQQAQIARQYGDEDEDAGDYADDGADLEDTTAELWDPEAEGDSPNVFTGAGRTDAKKADAFSAPAPHAFVEDEAIEEEACEDAAVADHHPAPATRETVFDTPPVSQSTFGARSQPTVEPESFDAETGTGEEDLDAPKLMRTVADLAPLTAQQKSEGGAWGEEEEEAVAEVPATGFAHGLSSAEGYDEEYDEDEDDVFGREEEATAEEEADEDFDPTVNNRFAAFLSRPAPQPVYDEDVRDDEDELVLDEAMQVETAASVASDGFDDGNEDEAAFESHELSSLDVAQARAGAKDKAAFTLRLDRERHLKLRLACALTGQSAQKMVTEALDRLLGEMTELDELVSQANIDSE